jgi:hypothetical protein
MSKNSTTAFGEQPFVLYEVSNATLAGRHFQAEHARITIKNFKALGYYKGQQSRAWRRCAARSSTVTH